MQQLFEVVHTWPPEQSDVDRQGTQAPVAVLHFLFVELLAAHWASVVQAAHWLLAQMGALVDVHSALTMQLTHAPSLRHLAAAAPLRVRHSELPVAMGLCVQARQVLLLVWQMGVVAPPQ